MSVLELPIKKDNQRKALDAAMQMRAALEILHSLPIHDTTFARVNMFEKTTLLITAIAALNLSTSQLLLKMANELKSASE